MSITDWSLAEIEHAPLVTILAEVYGPDLAAQVVCDVAAEIDALARGIVDLHPDGVWEEGYADALHDVLQRLGVSEETGGAS